MHFIAILFNSMMLMCTVYASIFGGRTGLAGSLIFVAATALTIIAFNAEPNWNNTSYGMFAVDLGCLLALIFLAMKSNRYWPIWATGFQIAAVATHLATMFAADTVPYAYRALLGFWSIPILLVMVLGTLKDRRFEWAATQARDGGSPI